MSSLTIDPDVSSPVPDPRAEIATEVGWWTNCTTAELKEIVAVGVAAGDRFDIAVREIERRSRASRSEAEALDAEKKRRDAKRGQQMRVAVAAGAVILAILVALLLAGRV